MVSSLMHGRAGSRMRPLAARRCGRMLAPLRAPNIGRYTPSWTRRSASPSSSPRSRSRRTTRSASRSSRSCGRACSRRGCARRPDSSSDVRDDRLLGGAAALRRLHRPRARGRHRVRRRDRDPRPDAGPRRRQPGRGDGRRGGVRDGRALRGGARGDHPDDPGDGARVGGAQLHVRVRGRPTCSCNGSTSAPRSGRRWRFTFERWNGKGFPAHAEGEAIPLRDARRAPQPRHGGDRPPLLARARARGRPRPPRPHLRPGARGSVRRPRARVVRPAPRDRALGRRPGARARAAPDAGGGGPRRGPDGRRRLHRPEVAVHGRAQPPLRGARRRRGAGARARRDAVTALRRAALVHDFGTTAVPELDLGQAGPAHAGGVRPRRAPPDADRADAAPLAGARRPQPGRGRATTRSATGPATTSARAPTPAIRRHACWRRRRSTWG